MVLVIAGVGCDRGVRFDDALLALGLSEHETNDARIVAATEAYGGVSVGWSGDPPKTCSPCDVW